MVNKYQLANGLTVLLQSSHKSPVVSVQMWVRTGSADEEPKVAGISHFIEHLVFKGSRSFKVGEIASIVEGSGGELNAYTSFDQTVFHVTISKTHADIGLKTISEMMGWPQFDAEEIDREREVVVEEIKRSNDSPQRQASRLLFETAFAGHPYDRPVIGYEEIIRNVSRQEIVDYYQGRYNPKNMFLVVVGDFNENDMKQKIQTHFAQMPTHPLLSVTRPQVPKMDAGKTAVKGSSFKENYMFLAWQIPGADHPDAPLFDVLALILGQGESSRLVHRLRIEQPLANSIGASSFSPLQSGLFCITGTFSLEKLESIQKAMIEEVVEFIAKGPNSAELEKALTNFESDAFYSMETVDGLARRAGHYEFLLKDPNYFGKFLEKVGKTTTSDILRIAHEYLDPKRMSICILTSNESVELVKKTSDQWRMDFARAFQQAINKAPEFKGDSGEQKKVDWQGAKIKSRHPMNENIILALPHGGTAIYRISRETPTVSLRAGFLGGIRAEGLRPQGLTEMLARTWDTATTTKSERELKALLDQKASSVSSFGGRNTVGLNLDTLRPFSREMLDVFSDLLKNPSLSEEIFNREREVLTVQLKNETDNPARLASYNFLDAMFANHPYSRRMAGTEESVALLDSRLARDYWQELINGTNCLFVASGDLDLDYLHEQISEICQHLGPGEKFTKFFQHDPLTADLHRFEQQTKEQSHIILGYKGLILTDPQRYTLQIMEAILAGQGGRLFLELRDKASLAYTVAPMRMEGVDTGYFGAYIGCSPEKGKVAVQMLKTEFQKLCESLVSDKELERAQNYLIGRHDIDLQRSSSISATIMFDAIYGLDAGEAFRFADRLMNVSKQDIQDLAIGIFSQHSVTSVVGPASLW